MTSFKITPTANGKYFIFTMTDVGKAHVDPKGKVEVTISYSDIIRLKLACEDARVRFQ
jgi:hypothetical protein